MQSEFKDGYWKSFSYYEKLFSVGKTIMIVYEDGRKEELKIKRKEIGEFSSWSSVNEIMIHSTEGETITVLLRTPSIKFFRIMSISARHEGNLSKIKELVIDGINIIGLQPLTIPLEYAVKTLKKKTRIYRQARKEEPIEKRKEYYFYADDPLYPFAGVASSGISRVLETKTGLYKAEKGHLRASGVYEYALSEDINILDLTTDGDGKKVWRCNIFSNNGTDPVKSVDNCANDKLYEKALIEACKQRGCVGFRAYVKVDNDYADFSDDDVYAELALLGSSPVVRIDCLKKEETSDQVTDYQETLFKLAKCKERITTFMVPRIQELAEELKEETEKNVKLEAEVKNLEEELEKIRAGGTSQSTSKRKRINYLHL